MYALYTDGSCLGNPGRGGWAARCVDLFDISGGTQVSTNNIMELTAVIKGLETCKAHGLTDVCVCTDSKYTVEGITTWIHGWKKRGWKIATGKPVKNKALWMTLDALVETYGGTIEWRWVKAHAGDVHNEWVDTEARRRAMEM